MFIQNESTPLHNAAFYGHPQIVKLLLAAGANKEALTYVSFILSHNIMLYNYYTERCGPSAVCCKQRTCRRAETSFRSWGKCRCC